MKLENTSLQEIVGDVKESVGAAEGRVKEFRTELDGVGESIGTCK
jgi:hypothetical protein